MLGDETEWNTCRHIFWIFCTQIWCTLKYSVEIQKGTWIYTHGGNYALVQADKLEQKRDKWTDEHRSAQTGIQKDANTHAGKTELRHPTDLASSWPLQRALKRLQDNLPRPLSVPSSLLPSVSPLPPSVLSLASVQTTNHIDGFVFNSLTPTSLPPPPHHPIPALPPAVWVTSRNTGLRNPKRYFGR